MEVYACRGARGAPYDDNPAHHDLVTVGPGTRLGAYEITALISSVSFSGPTIETGTPEPLFSKLEGPYTAALDGERFLVAATSEEASPITVLLNWAGARQAR